MRCTMNAFKKLSFLEIVTVTTKNTVISPNFQVWKFYGKAQFPQSLGRIATVRFNKISTSGN